MKTSVSAIIFDLGDVLYEISYPKLQASFLKLLEESESEILDFSKEKQDQLFTQLEKGLISPPEFLEQITEKYKLPNNPKKIIQAWNTQLVGIFPHIHSLINRLSQKYPLFLLSNTNKIHYDYFFKECEPIFRQFQKLYLSFELKMRKPEPEIYELILFEQNLKPETTLFIDDSAQNIEAANKIGIQTIHLTKPHHLPKLLAEKL